MMMAHDGHLTLREKLEKERMVAISETLIGNRFEVVRCTWQRGTGTEEAALC